MHLLPRRRWPRFSIRTLLIAVTVFCVWLGWQLQIVRERKAVRELVVHSGGIYGVYVENYGEPPDVAIAPTLVARRAFDIPWYRRLFGDIAVRKIKAPRRWPDAQLRRAADAYPEADIVGY
jgi:hypothetical protein